MGFVQKDTGNRATKSWVLIFSGLGMIYALIALRALIASDIVTFGVMAVAIPLGLPQLLSIWLHKRIYPFRNGVVKTHLTRALADTSIWKAKNEKKIRILDFGCGQGDTSWMLREIFGADVDITSVDVYTAPRWVGGPSTRVTYDGNVLPFDDKHFDFAIAGQVLHHIPDNKQSIAEISRTAKTALIVEDLVKPGEFQAEFCYFWDSLWNWDFFDNPPHTNRSHEGWIALFTENKMKVASSHFTSIAFAKDLYAKEPEEVFKNSLLANGVYYLETA